MNVLIMEDEQVAAERLKDMLEQLRPAVKIGAIAESVGAAIAYLRTAALPPDLILADIQLADGISFEVWEQAPTNIPVIFTTAYNHYTLRAFKLNSIDYLLKPIDREELHAALRKYETIGTSRTDPALAALLSRIGGNPMVYRSRFLVKKADGFSFVPSTDIACIRADDKLVFLHLNDGQMHLTDERLDDLEQALDPACFFRANRSYIIHIDALKRISSHFNGRLKIELKNVEHNDLFISRQRVRDFKNWLNR